MGRVWPVTEALKDSADRGNNMRSGSKHCEMRLSEEKMFMSMILHKLGQN